MFQMEIEWLKMGRYNRDGTNTLSNESKFFDFDIISYKQWLSSDKKKWITLHTLCAP